MQKGSKIKDLARAAVFAAVAFFAFASAQAEWLYWQVDFSAPGAKELVPAWSDTENAPYVWLVAVDKQGNRTTLSGVTEDGVEVKYIQLDQSEDEDDGTLSSKFAMEVASDKLGDLGSSLTEYTFLVELGNLVYDSTGKVTEEAMYTTVTPQTYTQLSNNNYIGEENAFSNMSSWNPALIGFKAVPEPTGGMLFGFGLCLLALRRRRKRGAA